MKTGVWQSSFKICAGHSWRDSNIPRWKCKLCITIIYISDTGLPATELSYIILLIRLHALSLPFLVTHHRIKNSTVRDFPLMFANLLDEATQDCMYLLICHPTWTFLHEFKLEIIIINKSFVFLVEGGEGLGDLFARREKRGMCSKMGQE